MRWVILIFLLPAMLWADDRNLPSSTVGMRFTLTQVIIDGSEVEAKPIANSAEPIVVRVLETYPGVTFHRYDLEYYGLEPGTYNLVDYLQRKDGTTLEGVRPVLVRVNPLLPPGQIQPHELAATEVPELGGYRNLRNLAIGVWAVGLLAILFWRKPKFREASEGEGAKPVSFADQLRPLVEQARSGELEETKRAHLERMLLGYWRRKLNLQLSDPLEAMAKLREHPEAGPLIRKLEEWLHRPPGRGDEVDVADLLEPYENVTEQPA